MTYSYPGQSLSHFSVQKREGICTLFSNERKHISNSTSQQINQAGSSSFIGLCQLLRASFTSKQTIDSSPLITLKIFFKSILHFNNVLLLYNP